MADGNYTVSITDEANVLSGYWHSIGTNPGNDNNSQTIDYGVSVSGGVNNSTGDFGFYQTPASLGNVVFEDINNDGLRDALNEPGIAGVPVTLTITYPNTDVISLTTTTDELGNYSFANLLSDESYNGASGSEPTYSISVGTTDPDLAGFTSSYDGVADTAGIGNGTNNNSDNESGEAGFPVQGGIDNSNDFGFAPPGVIGNRIWLDLDGDGNQDANEDGIANLTVTLTPPAGIDLGAGPGMAVMTITDNDGNYLFKDVPLASGYVVTVTTPPSGLNQTYDEDGTGTAHSSVVNLSTGNEEYLTADFGYGPAAGTIGDYVWADADGDGVQDPGEIGLPNVTVELYDSSNMLLQSVTTDDTGHYLFTGVNVANVHEVRIDTATLPAGYTQTGDPDGVGAPDDETTVLALNTSNGINMDADFGYQPPAAAHSNIGDTLYVDLNGDGDQDVGEPGVTGVTVHLLLDTNSDGTPDTPIAAVETDSSGNYLFPSLPNGETYTVVVTDSNNILNAYQQTDDPDATLDGQSTVAALAANNIDQDFGYVPKSGNTGVIGNFIFNDVNANNTQDAQDQGLEGVRVRLLNNTGDLLDVVKTDENGHYLFTGLDPTATYQVVIDQTTLPGGSASWTNTIDPDGVANGNTTVDLSIEANGISLAEDFGFIGTTSNSLGGTVWRESTVDGLLTDGSGGTVDELSNGIPNVKIILRDANGNIVATQFTDADGDYLFSGLPDGNYTVEVDDVFNELATLTHTNGPNPGSDNNSQDDTGYAVSLSGGETNTTADFGYAPPTTTPVTLAYFEVYYDSSSDQSVVNWATATETGNTGFEVWYLNNGDWLKAPIKPIAAKGVYSEKLIQYQIVISGLKANHWRITDIDITGKQANHGPYQSNQVYGTKMTKSASNLIDWQSIHLIHQQLKDQRKDESAKQLNQIIQSHKQKTQGEQQ